MKFKAAVTVVPSSDSKSTESKDILKHLKKLKVSNVSEVVVGRFFSVEIDANSKNAAAALVDEISSLLINKEEVASFVIEEI